MENQLTAVVTAPADLSRLRIRIDIPPPIAVLIIDLLGMLPDPDAKRFVQDLAAMQAGNDLSRAPARFLHWLLLDPVHGAIALSKRDDVKDSIRRVASDVLAPMAEGLPIQSTATKAALFNAQIAQLKTWHAYEHGHAIEALQPRIEWMIATAATDALSPSRPEQLIGAVHSCAVAWSAARQDHLLAIPSITLQLAIRDQLLELLASQPAAHAETHQVQFDQVGARDRVEFDDPHDGPQKGTVIGIVNSPEAPATAVILVDHSMEGVTWNVPLRDLKRMETAAA
jgi:hypothetical protein